MSNFILDGIIGLTVGDGLGVPVEFKDRDSLIQNPVTGMKSYGTYNQPAGTWSDDTSMTLCLAESLIQCLDYNNIMDKFMKWFNNGEYTPHGELFDIGNTTREALLRYNKGINALECGGKSEYDNGNGSLMRILPISFYIQSIYGSYFKETEEVFNIIHNVSSLTHGHKRSMMACGIYISIALNLLGGSGLESAIESGIYNAMEYYRGQDDFQLELNYFTRLEDRNFRNLPIEEIKSSGYVIDTLEATIWCLLNTDDYKSCVLKAVNLGNDTDTVGAVAGGLAGIVYGYKSIPNEWKQAIVNRKYIEDLCNKLYMSLTNTSAIKVLKYIKYFETATEESVCKYQGGENVAVNTYTFGYPVYDDKLLEFVDEVYKTNLICSDYLSVIKNKIGDMSMIDYFIATADIELLRAILTGYIRQERFNDGLWATAVKDKVFLKILYRLKNVLEL